MAMTSVENVTRWQSDSGKQQFYGARVFRMHRPLCESLDGRGLARIAATRGAVEEEESGSGSCRHR
jgi:hypothetical protein